MRILGIDPGSTVTGYGVIDRDAGRVAHVAHGTLRPRRGAPLPQRLHELRHELAAVIERHAPDVAVVEQVFVAASPRSALVLGQARGAVLAAIGGAGIALSEYAAASIKQAVAGDGRANKSAVQKMVRRTLALERTPASDAADALAVAITHAHAERLGALAPRRRGRSLRSLGAALSGPGSPRSRPR